MTRGRYDRSQSTIERRAHQRAALLDAATPVFAKRGFARTSVEAIVSAAGMSRRTFYGHFRDVRDIIHQVHERAAGLAFEFVSEQVRSHDDPVDRVRAGIQAFLTAVAANGPLARVVFREIRAAGPEYEALRERETQRYADLLLNALREAHRRGQIPNPPDETTTYAITTGVEGIAMRYVARRQEHRALEAAPALVGLALRAFGANHH